jgi:two-component system cell cycle response regulator DivK
MSNEPILIVDDHPLNRKLIQVLLRIERYQVATAENVEEAVLAAEAFRPRLVLVDNRLGDQSGVALVKRLKADPRHRDVACVLLSSDDRPGDEARARAAGCVGYLRKPLDTRTFPAWVAGFLDQPVDAPTAPHHEPQTKN